jgi:HTH-type transcriptional regulator/antitoxin HigA
MQPARRLEAETKLESRPMNIRPISTDEDYEAALEEIKRLWSAEAGSPEAQKGAVLAMLAQSYERAREPLPEADPIEAIKFRMDQQGLSRRDLLPIFGTTARISEVLSGRRSLTLEMVRKLHFSLGIPLDSLIVPEERRKATPPTHRGKNQGKRLGKHRGRRQARQHRAA